MKKMLRYSLVVAFIAIGGIAFFYGPQIYDIVTLVNSIGQQMKIGKSYMDSMEESAFPKWIERTKALIEKYATPGSHIELLDAQVPQDLRSIGLLRVDVAMESVRYVWVGGMDHTNLYIVRNENGDFDIFAQYSDSIPEIKLWPK